MNGLKKKLSISGICLGCISMGLVFTMVNTALPTIQRETNTPLIYMQWMMMVFGIINCATLVTFGRLADIFGRKKIFLLGLFFSCLGMYVCGSSRGVTMLILGMAFAGLGNAVLLPVSQAMIVSEFKLSEKSQAIAIWSLAIAYAFAMGPLLAGIICKFYPWRWIFYFMVPVFLICALIVYTFTSESKNDIDSQTIDFKGMVLVAICLACLSFFISEFSSLPFWFKGTLSVLVISTIVLIWHHSLRFSMPILLPEIIINFRFLAASICSTCLIFSIWSTFFIFPFFLENIRLLSPFTKGLIMLGVTIPMFFFARIIGRKYTYSNAWIMIAFGFVSLILSSILQLFLNEYTPISMLICVTTLFGLGFVLIAGPSTTAALSTAPSYRAGIASGTFVTFQEIGGTLGLAFTVTALRGAQIPLRGFYKRQVIMILMGFLGVFFSFFLRDRKSTKS